MLRSPGQPQRANLIVLVLSLIGVPCQSFSPSIPRSAASAISRSSAIRDITEIEGIPFQASSPAPTYLSVLEDVERDDDDPTLKCEERDLMSRRFFLSALAVTAAAVTIVEQPGQCDAAEETLHVATQQGSTQESPFIENHQTLTAAEAVAARTTVDFAPIFQKAAKKALGGGKAGASAAIVQVLSLMWLRTAMNYQYRYGGNLGSSLKKLVSEGGIPRLYQGLPFALVQGPMTRFGDTAANVGVLALLDSIPETAVLPLPLRTACGSVAAGLWRIFLMPVDTSKTAMQVEGSEGLERLKQKVLDVGPGPLYQGAFASAAATAAGHFPWFLTYNFLNDVLPAVSKEELLLSLVRSAFLGLSASCVSDCCSNSLRVIKTTKQTAALNKESAGSSDAGPTEELSYGEVVSLILETDGVRGLFGRGLQTRLLTNAVQGAAFSVLWKYFQTAQ